jgi:hypothetical protein
MQFRIKKVDRAFAFFILSFACLAAALIVSLWPQQEDFAYLRTPSPQAVSNEIPGRGPATAFIGEGWNVTAEKCNDADRQVRLIGFISWDQVSPNGSPIGSVEAQADRLPGCTLFEFKNDPPAEVLDVMEKDAAGGIEVGVWRTVGTESAVGYTECFPREEALERDDHGYGALDVPQCQEGELSVVVEEINDSTTAEWFTDNVSVYAE